MNDQEHIFLKELEKKLWTAADKLRSTLSASEYKTAVLGLIFIKYVSDTFKERREELEAAFKDNTNVYYLNPDDYDSKEEYEEDLYNELEIRDYYKEKNVFWVPEMSRWDILKDNAKLPLGTPLKDGTKMPNVGKLIDNALELIEKDNPELKNILNKTYARLNLDDAKLGELIDLISTIPFSHESLKSKDILGHVYEYFIGEFAMAEGKKGGQFYTPKAIVKLIVEMLEPYKGRVYDPAMGSGGFFVQSQRFLEAHSDKRGSISVYGQEYNYTTWQLAAMNMAIRGIDFNFGKQPADTFTNDQHPDLRADFVMANPPFNMKEWWNAKLEGDPRWKYGTPSQNNANFAWMQHMIYHLAPNGSMGLLLSNGSMSSGTGGEGDIRKAIIEADLVECMVALPGQLFTNTQIPACIWFLTRNKGERNGYRDRKGEILFIDARNLGYMKDRVLRDFSEEDIQKIIDTFHNWKKGKNYEDVLGFCKAAKYEDIVEKEFALAPGRYVGINDAKDNEPSSEKIEQLINKLSTQFGKSADIESEIKRQLAGIGYEC